MSHSSMLKARRKYQTIKKQIEGEEKKANRAAKLALKGPVEKKEKVKKERVKKEKVVTEKVAKKPKLTKEEVSRQESKAKSGAGKDKDKKG